MLLDVGGARGASLLRRALTGFAMIALGAIFAMASAFAGETEVWFAPRLPRAPHTHVLGIEDWQALLRPDAPWQRAAAHTQVFGLSRGYIMDASDAELKAMAAAMAARGIAIATSMQPVAIEASDNCGKTEGYDSPRGVADLAAKLKRNGVPLKYLGLDGPLWFGHYATGAQECRFSLDETVRRTAQNLRLMTDAFPDLIVGDVEGAPLTLQPGWREDYARFKQGLEAAADRPLSFLQLDIGWRRPDWPEATGSLAAMARSLGMKLGIIYDGDNKDKDDAGWIAHAWRNVIRTESELGIIPDQAIFASWNLFPTRALPETSPEAHTWLLLQYALPRTRFAAQRDGERWRVRLVDAAGHPLAGERVTIEAVGQDPAQPPPLHTASGRVPEEAASAILGWRVNTECLCLGDNDLIVGDLVYREQEGGSVSHVLDLAQTAERRQPGVEIAALGQVGDRPLYRVRVRRDSRLLVNSPIFPVTPGARYDLRAALGAVDPGGLYGAATIIWLDRDGHGLSRTNIDDAGDRTPAGTATTDKAGEFVIDGGARPLRLYFAGTAALRPAIRILDNSAG